MDLTFFWLTGSLRFSFREDVKPVKVAVLKSVSEWVCYARAFDLIAFVVVDRSTAELLRKKGKFT